MRASGVLLPISSIPSNYGIGCFSKEAFGFVDQLVRGGQKYWQILPLGPTGFGDSPYQAFSTFAGNPYFIDLEVFIREGMLTEWDCHNCDWGGSESYVDYAKIYNNRFRLLRMAFSRFNAENDPEYARFVENNAYWLQDYCLFMAIKNEQGGIAWWDWEEDLRKKDPDAIAEAEKRLDEEIRFFRFQQYWFFKQWCWLKTYANNCGIKIIGDVPIYLALDSADTWSRPELFQFDEEGRPAAVAGCPPDGFSATGQLWGNPVYDWKYHKKTGYEWWIRRMEHCMELYDVVRIDHFRGFEAYYSIPYGDPTAEFGHWEKGPGYELFKVMKEKLGEKNIIAEDLGFLTPGVKRLVKRTGYPGMKILEFAFDSAEDNDYLPHNYDSNCVVYTGTHDNDTAIGWYKTLAKKDQFFTREYLGIKNAKNIGYELIRLALSSVADTAIIPLQDYLELGSEARINTPSTLGNNWNWRMKEDALDSKLASRIRRLSELYGRI